jgi:alkaline phosphatase
LEYAFMNVLRSRGRQVAVAATAPAVVALPAAAIAGDSHPDRTQAVQGGTARNVILLLGDGGAISARPSAKPVPTILELARKAGYRTGDVSTAELQDATPAVLGSHVISRDCKGPARPSTSRTTPPTRAAKSVRPARSTRRSRRWPAGRQRAGRHQPDRPLFFTFKQALGR